MAVETSRYQSRCGSERQRLLAPAVFHRSGIRQLPTFHAIIMRGDDLPRIAALQPRVGPDLADLCVRPGLVFAHRVFAAIDNGKTVSEETHFSIIKFAIISCAWTFLVLQFIGLREVHTLR